MQIRERNASSKKRISPLATLFFLYFIYLFPFTGILQEHQIDTYKKLPCKLQRKENNNKKDYTTLHDTTLHYATRIITHIQLELKLKSNLGNLRKRSLGNSYCCINGSRGFHFLSWNWILLFFFRDKTFGLKRLFKFID